MVPSFPRLALTEQGRGLGESAACPKLAGPKVVLGLLAFPYKFAFLTGQSLGSNLES